MDNGEELNGIVALGVPIGSKNFVLASLQEFASDLLEDTTTILSSFDNLQLAGQIYTICLVTRAPFSMLADMAAYASLDVDYVNQKWTSPTASSIEKTNKMVLQSLVKVSHLPSYAYAIATLPESMNGLGFFYLKKSAINCFAIPWQGQSATLSLVFHWEKTQPPSHNTLYHYLPTGRPPPFPSSAYTNT
eukprot:8000636-Ditylum_brightwellii.AAC.1